MNNVRPKKKLVIAERTRFISLCQESSESILNILHRLRDGSQYCEFDKLGQDDQSIKEN